MNTTKYFFITFTACFFINNVFAEIELDQEPNILGTVWQLERNGSSSISYGNGQVVYFFSSDAYQTYQSRRFSQWDSFSAVDSRDLVRLKKRQRIQLQMAKFNEAIYEVQLLDGFHAGKTYYLIAEELKKNFIQEKDNEEAS
jgi:YHS domain-containing protein|tara:strand:- start:1121 stop:1546 length:426 start_codon:yes stop_codon:yes gene_type:complete